MRGPENRERTNLRNWRLVNNIKLGKMETLLKIAIEKHRETENIIKSSCR